MYCCCHEICHTLLNRQFPILKKAATEHPGGDWWIKADSCDLTPGLMESVERKWRGDVDLNDGEVNKLYQNYKERQNICLRFGLKEPRSIHMINFQADNIRNEIIKPDMTFISKGTKYNNFNNNYY